MMVYVFSTKNVGREGRGGEKRAGEGEGGRGEKRKGREWGEGEGGIKEGKEKRGTLLDSWKPCLSAISTIDRDTKTWMWQLKGVV